MKTIKLILDLFWIFLDLAFNLYAIYYIARISIFIDNPTTKELSLEIALGVLLLSNGITAKFKSLKEK